MTIEELTLEIKSMQSSTRTKEEALALLQAARVLDANGELNEFFSDSCSHEDQDTLDKS